MWFYGFPLAPGFLWLTITLSSENEKTLKLFIHSRPVFSCKNAHKRIFCLLEKSICLRESNAPRVAAPKRFLVGVGLRHHTYTKVERLRTAFYTPQCLVRRHHPPPTHIFFAKYRKKCGHFKQMQGGVKPSSLRVSAFLHATMYMHKRNCFFLLVI